jgi:hypothetical protein
MTVELTKTDLIALVKGVEPNYDLFDNPLIAANGSYVGGFVDKWSWSFNINKITESELWEIYNLCKNSWDKTFNEHTIVTENPEQWHEQMHKQILDHFELGLKKETDRITLLKKMYNFIGKPLMDGAAYTCFFELKSVLKSGIWLYFTEIPIEQQCWEGLAGFTEKFNDNDNQ